MHHSTITTYPVIALTGLLVCGGCATSGGEQSSEATAAESEQTDDDTSSESETPDYVRVLSSADFATRPDDEADTWSHAPGHQWRFRVVSTSGDWLELEPAEADAGPAPILKQVDLRVFVKREDTEPAPDTPGTSPDPETPPQEYQLTWAAPGSPLYWSDGSKAGEVGDARWPLRLELEGRDGRRCFAANLRESAPKSFDPDRHFRICIAEVNLSENPDAPRAASQSSTDQEGPFVGMINVEVDIRFRGVDGGLSWERIKSPVVERQQAVKSCYDEAVTPQNLFDGNLAVRLQIAPTGEVRSVETTDTSLPDDTVPNCVGDALEQASFPSAANDTELELEFVFSSSTE